MNPEHVMTLRAYARKEELGGGYRGAVVLQPTKERIESPVLSTYEAARHWAQTEAHARMAGRPYRRSHVAGRTKESYYANVWA